jgi:surface-anchored protein
MRALTRDRRAFTAAVLAAATAVLLGAAGLVAGGSGSARAAGGAVVLDAGELDFTPRPVGGKPQLQIDDRGGATAVLREPSEVVLHVPQATLQYTPNPIAVALGTTDQDTWQLNGWEAENLFAPEPGWNGTKAGGDTEVTLSGFKGPGDFGMATYTQEMDWSDGSPEIHLGNTDSAPDSFTLAADRQRLLPIWMFTAEGIYRLTFTVTAGDSTDTETLAVVVGDDVDPADVLPGDGTTPTSSSPSDSAGPSDSTTPTVSAPTAHVIDNGHIDLAARPVDGKLQFQIKEGTAQAYEWYEPDEVVLHVKPSAMRRITEGHEFLGTVGDPVWWLPIQQVDGLVWPGWNTEQYAAADVDGDITYRLDAVRGPGAVAMFHSGSLGSADITFNSGDGLPDSYPLTPNRHSHFNWTFTKEGVYRTTFTVGATLSDGRKVSDTGTIAWVVGDDTDPSTVTPGPGDEPTATPTVTAPPSDAPSTPSTASPSASATPTAGGVGSDSRGTTSGSSSSGSSSGGAVPTGGFASTGALASTGTGVGVIAGIAAVALLLGGGAVFATRRRGTAQ